MSATLSVTEAHPKEEESLGEKEAATATTRKRQMELCETSEWGQLQTAWGRVQRRIGCPACEDEYCGSCDEVYNQMEDALARIAGKMVLSEHAPKSDSGSEYPQAPVSEVPYVSSETGEERELNAIRRAAGYPSEHPKEGEQTMRVPCVWREADDLIICKLPCMEDFRISNEGAKLLRDQLMVVVPWEKEPPSATTHVLQNALKEIIEAAETVLDNAHWEVRYGSGDLTDAINHGKKVLSEHGGEQSTPPVPLNLLLLPYRSPIRR